MVESRPHGNARGQWNTRSVVIVLLVSFAATSCYSYRTHAPGYPGVTEGGGQTTWSFLWGIFNQEPVVDCNDQPLAEVTVVDNFGFTLLTVVTLGIVNPKQIEWKCARANPTTGGFDTPVPDSAAVPADSTPGSDAGPTDSNGSE